MIGDWVTWFRYSLSSLGSAVSKLSYKLVFFPLMHFWRCDFRGIDWYIIFCVATAIITTSIVIRMVPSILSCWTIGVRQLELTYSCDRIYVEYDWPMFGEWVYLLCWQYIYSCNRPPSLTLDLFRAFRSSVRN